MQTLVVLGKPAEAIRYAEDSRGRNEPDGQISSCCEAILLSIGKHDEAYSRYALEANTKTTHLATFRAVVRKDAYAVVMKAASVAGTETDVINQPSGLCTLPALASFWRRYWGVMCQKAEGMQNALNYCLREMLVASKTEDPELYCSAR